MKMNLGLNLKNVDTTSKPQGLYTFWKRIKASYNGPTVLFTLCICMEEQRVHATIYWLRPRPTREKQLLTGQKKKKKSIFCFKGGNGAN